MMLDKPEDVTQWKSYLYELQQQAPTPRPLACSKKLKYHPAHYGHAFHGSLLREHSDTMLLREPDGTYLVRQSTNPPGSYTLSIKFNNAVKNFKLFFDNNSHYVGDKKFASLDDLVHDGLIVFYVETYAADYIKNMSKEVIYADCPHMAEKRVALTTTLRDRGKNATHINRANSITDHFNIIQSEKPHSFNLHSFKGPHWCDYCANFMWGLISQGVKCSDCGFQAHRRCSDHVPADCVPQLKYVRSMFGVDLTTLVKAHASSGIIVPIVVYKCIQEIEKRKGYLVEGLYRTSPFTCEINNVKIAFERDGVSIDMASFSDIFAIAGALKLYLRMLPIPLITFDVHSTLLKLKVMSAKTITSCLRSLPPAHLHTLRFLVNHLRKVCYNRNQNGMDAEQLAVIFAPAITHAPNPDPVIALRNSDIERRIVHVLIDVPFEI